MDALIAALTTAAIGIIGALAAYITAKLKKNTTKEEIEELKMKQQALEGELCDVKKLASIHKLYVECPKCHTEIDLSEVEIYTKDEEVSND